MALTQTEVSQLYVSIFGRASEGDGNTYWQTDQDDMVTTADGMLATNAAKDYFGETINDDQAFIEHIYENTLGKTIADDPDGIAYWVAQLESGKSKGTVVTELITAAIDPANAGNAQDQFNNKVDVSNYTADTLAEFTDLTTFSDLIADVDETDASVQDAMEDVNSLTPGDSFTLTNATDIATAATFTAPMVFVPDGSDRILSLQDEDILTGTEGRNDNTLNVTMGNQNADEGTTVTTTPQLNNIQNINIDWTGNTRTLDIRNADATESVNIQRVTADATGVNVDNIGTPAGNMSVANTASEDVAVLFQYKRGVLTDTNAPDREMNLQLDDVLADTITQNARGTGALVEGFNTVNLNAVNGVDINTLTVNEMESLVITGDNYLDIVELTPTAPVSTTEFNALGAPGIANPAAVGLLNLDASAFEGDLTLDITNSLGGFNDPSNSGAIVHGVVTAGVGDDTFWAGANVAATSATNRDVIDGGEGANTLITTAGVVGNAAISNIQTLELRQQGAAQTVDFDAFGAELTSVLMRDEAPDAAAAVFNLNDLGTDLAENGLVLRHSITDAVAGTDVIVNANLKDATGNNDSIAITVENDLNTTTIFDYTLNLDGAGGAGAVENVTINDNDTESNIVDLGQAQEQSGTLTLTGGVAGQSYTVNSSLVASVIEASAQLSNLRLTVGDTVAPITSIAQDIRLGAGDDILTFANIDDFATTDTISDAGGDDTVRAAFSDDANLTLTDIENLHIIANDNVSLGMANADIENLVILADIAADGDIDNSPVTVEPFNIAGVAATDIITMTDTNLTALNFSADLDNDDSGNTGAAVNDDDAVAAVFNGVTLANNSANALTVNINSALDFVDIGAQTYTLGQLTTHGITSMDIQVSDEDTETTVTAATAVTTINNIYAKNMTSLSVTAQGDVDLNTVSGAGLNNSLTTFDSTNVVGDLTARIISLGNDATVAMGDGDNTLNALGSAGKDIEITAGNGANTITGSAQSDTIITGSGWDTIAADRGDNVISSGAGNDTLTAKDGNDIFDVGTGVSTVIDNFNTNINASLATNTISMSGGITKIAIDVDGNGAIGVADILQTLSVGVGSDLTMSWTGSTLLDNSAVLDGRLAVVENAPGAAIINGDANSNLSIIAGAGSTLQSTGLAGTSTGVKTFNGAGGNDVVMWTGSAAGDGLIFNGGAGNDAAMGTIDNDIFTGGMGADIISMSDTTFVLDGMVDTIVIADGESTAAGWDIITDFDSAGVAGVAGVAAGSTTVGDDVFDLASNLISAAAANVDGTDVGAVESHTIDGFGLATFDINDADAFAAVTVGTAAGQVSLADTLGYLATALNGTSETVAFNYDANGDGAVDNTFIFQDGAEDTVIELTGVFTGLEAVAGGTAGLIEIA